MVKLCSQNIFVWYIQTIENTKNTRLSKIYYHKKENKCKYLKKIIKPKR